jgi:hypothetical protein
MFLRYGKGEVVRRMVSMSLELPEGADELPFEDREERSRFGFFGFGQSEPEGVALSWSERRVPGQVLPRTGGRLGRPAGSDERRHEHSNGTAQRSTSHGPDGITIEGVRAPAEMGVQHVPIRAKAASRRIEA